MIMIDFSKCYFFEDKSPRRSTEKRSLRALAGPCICPPRLISPWWLDFSDRRRKCSIIANTVYELFELLTSY